MNGSIIVLVEDKGGITVLTKVMEGGLNLMKKDRVEKLYLPL